MSNMKHLCDDCSADYRINLRSQLNKAVFQPDICQPTMTLEEFADREMERAKELQVKTNQANKAAEDEKNEDSDKEEYDDKKTKKARDWDNWKDDHEKGAGNKMKNR